MSTIWSFDHIETKHTLYREKDYIKTLCKKRLYKNFKRTAINIIDFEKKNVTLNKSRIKSHIKMQKYVIFVEKES